MLDQVLHLVKYARMTDLDTLPLYISSLSRVGWSVDSAGLSLGEAHNSYGYGGVGKAVVNNRYTEYGEPYGPGDVIGCYVV